MLYSGSSSYSNLLGEMPWNQHSRSDYSLPWVCIIYVICLHVCLIYRLRINVVLLSVLLLFLFRHVLAEEADLNSTCNSECGCSTSTYEPVCADGIQYFSPCHAGCSMEPVETGDDMVMISLLDRYKNNKMYFYALYYCFIICQGNIKNP